MSLIRPELAARLAPWRPAGVAAAVLLGGLWTASRGGFVLVPAGLALAALAAGWLAVELGRLRLGRAGQGPGLVEIEEGAVRYFAPRGLGGELPLRELAEIRILRLNGRVHWRLRSQGGEALLIPVDAAGAGRLADGFAALPGADLNRLATALARAEAGGPSVATVWTRGA